jgi:catechol 2,3-dioxygenase-like lactoylglutathione lyase family enzyme
VDHFGFTVPSLDVASRFLVSAFGAVPCYREGPIEHPDDDWMSRRLGVHPRASADIELLRLGPLHNLELFEYRAPGRRTVPPGPGEPGAYRLAVRVAPADLPSRSLAGELLGAGGGWAYLRTPWGGPLKLVARPGPVGLDHISFTVRDLDATLDLFVGVLGARFVREDGPVGVAADPECQALGIGPAGRVRRARLAVGPTIEVELVEYLGTGAAGIPPANSDAGGHHLAFHADDVDAAAGFLRTQPGVRVMGEPETVRSGPIAGDRWVYFATSVGIQMEVLNMPAGLPYESTTSARRASWQAGAPGRVEEAYR